MPSMDTVVTSLGDVRAHTHKVCEEIANRWTLYFIWGIGPSGEHAEGRALDFMTYTLGGGVNSPGPVRVEMGWDIARYLWKHRERLGGWYVIYRQQIISINDNSYGPAGQWNQMPDRGDPTANHMDHPHVSLVNNPPAYQPPAGQPPAEEDMSLDRSDIRNIFFTDGIIPAPSNSPSKETNKHWELQRYLKELADAVVYPKPFTKPYFPNENRISEREANRWTHSRVKALEPVIEKTAARTAAILDALEGHDDQAILARIDQRAAQGSAERAELVERLDVLEVSLDQLRGVLEQHADGSLDAAEVVEALKQLLHQATAPFPTLETEEEGGPT